MNTSDVLLKPIVSEGAIKAIATDNRYTFIVNKQADKRMIAEAVRKIFGVTVTGVRTVTLKGGKRRIVGRRLQYALQPDMKKAIIQVKKGESIDLFDTGESKEDKKKAKKAKKQEKK